MKKMLTLTFMISLTSGLHAQAMNQPDLVTAPSNITAVCIHYDTIYIATEKHGVYRLKSDGWQLQPMPYNHRLKGTVNDMKLHTDGSLHLATNKGLYVVSQDTIRKVYSKQDGFISDEILSIDIAFDGAIWAGTPKGLVYMDRYNYRIYTTANGLPDNNIQKIRIDPYHRPWILSGDQLVIFTGSKFETVKTKIGSHPVKNIVDYAFDEKGHALVSSKSMLLKLKDTKVKTEIEENIYQLSEDPYGRIYGISAKKLIRFDFENEDRILKTEIGSFSSQITSPKVYIDLAGNKYLVSHSSLLISKTRKADDSLYAASLYQLAVAKGIIGEYEQAIKIHHIIKINFPLLSNLAVYKFHYAQMQELLGHSEESLLSYLEITHSTAPPPRKEENPDLQNLYFTALLKTANAYRRNQNNLCIGYYRSIIQNSNNQSLADSAIFYLSEFYIQKNLQNEAVEVMEEYLTRFPQSARYWEIVAKLLLIYRETNPQRFKALYADFFANCTDVSLLMQFDKDYTDYQLQKLITMYELKMKDGITAFPLPVKVTSAASYADTWWLGTDQQKIFRIKVSYENEVKFEIHPYELSNGFSGQYVNNIFIDSKGNPWFSCLSRNAKTGGLFYYDGVKFWQYNSLNGLESDSIFAACERNGKIWCLTNKGIYSASLSNKNVWKKVTKVSPPIFSFTVDAQERILLTDGNQCTIIEKGKAQIIKSENIDSKFSGLKITKIQSEADGYSYIYTNSGLYYEKNGKIIPKYTLPEGYARKIKTYLLDEEDIWFGHSSGISRYQSLYLIHYDQNDGLPSEDVLHLSRWKNYKIAVTERGLALMQESVADTIKIIRAISEIEQQLIHNYSFSQARQMYRRIPKNTPFRDYANYRIGMLFYFENKVPEALNWFMENAHKDHPFITPYVFWKFSEYYIGQKEHERAYNVLIEAIKIFTNSSKKEGDRQRVDMKAEQNQMLKSIAKGMDKIAFKYYQQKDWKLSLLWYVRSLHLFYNRAQIPEGLVDFGAFLDTQKDPQKTFMLYRIATNSVMAQEVDYHMCFLWWKMALLYYQKGQFKEVAQVLRKIEEAAPFNVVQREITRLKRFAESSSSIAVQVQKGGYEEANTIHDMIFEGNYLWLATSKGVVRWDLTKNSYNKWNEEDGLVVDNIYSIALSPDGTKWFGGYKMLPDGQIKGGVSYFDGELFINYTKDNELLTNRVHCVAVCRKGILWVGTDLGVSKFENKWIHYSLKKKFDFTYVSGLSFDSENRLWISCMTLNDFYSTSGGVILFDEVHAKVFLEKNGLISNNAKSIKHDAQNNLWVSTDKGISIFQVNSKAFINISEKNGLPPAVVRDVVFGDSNFCWVSTNQGILKMNFLELINKSRADQTATFVHYSEKRGLLINDIRRSVYHPEHGLWCGTKKGSFRIMSLATENDLEKDLLDYNRKYFEISYDSELLFEKAQQYLEAGDYEKAREIYLDVLDRSGTTQWADDAVLLIAQSYELEGNYDEAEKYYHLLIQNYAESDLISEAYVGIGMIAEKRNKYDEAINAFENSAAKARNRASRDKALILKQKSELKRLAYERQRIEMLAAKIADKTNELRFAKDKYADELRSEIHELEIQAQKSAKLAGYEMRLYKVKRDDTLWDLSREFIGDPFKWKDFFIANEGKITDPNLIYEGQTIVVLTLKKGYKEKLDEFVVYKVSAGEDLETIAKKLYGDGKKWVNIYKANKEKCPNSPKKSLPEIEILIPVLD